MTTLEKLRELKCKAVADKNYGLGATFRDLEKMLMKEMGIQEQQQPIDESIPKQWQWNKSPTRIGFDITEKIIF